MKSLQKRLWENKKTVSLFLFAILSCIASFLIGICVGSTRISLSDLLRAAADIGCQTPEGRIFWYVRVPRTLAAILAGGALSLAGAVTQGALGNRLASPSVIGVNAGAGFFVTVASAFGILGGIRLSLFAFLGALITVMLIYMGTKKWGLSRGTVILIGVAFNSLLGAASDAVAVLVPDAMAMSTAFRVGDFSSVSRTTLISAGIIILLGAAFLLLLSNAFDVLSLGDENAMGLGLRAGTFRAIFLTLAALLAGAAVSMAGLLSFVGLLVPHAVRRAFGTGARRLFPLSFLLGGAFVALCDTLARALFSPYEIPVGIPMALIGAPFFILLLVKGRREENA